MATFHLIIHVYEHPARPWTYSVRAVRKMSSGDIRFPIFSVTGTLPYDSVDPPEVLFRTVLRRLGA